MIVRAVAFIAMLLLGVVTIVYAAPPIPVTACGEISESGNYALTGDFNLVTTRVQPGAGGNCLTISASNVTHNLAGYTIGVECTSPYPDCFSDGGYSDVGNIGILIEAGADHVSILGEGGTVGTGVGNFDYDIVVEGNYSVVKNINTLGIVSLTLQDASNGVFSNVAYLGDGNEPYHTGDGPLLSVSGGGYNDFVNLSAKFVGGGIGSFDGMVLSGSNHNDIFNSNVNVTGNIGGAGILLTGNSDYNEVGNNIISDLATNGIEVDSVSEHNKVAGNNVSILSPLTEFAMLDENAGCGSNIWMSNTFVNTSPGSGDSASPASCIH